MKSPRYNFRSNRGSALMVVMIMMLIIALLTGSMLSFSTSERRHNEFNKLVLRTRNMAENTVNYGTAQLRAKLRRTRNLNAAKYSPSASGQAQLHFPGNNLLTTEYNPGTIDLHAGLFSSTPLTYIDPANPANASNPYTNLSVIMSRGTIMGKATISNPRVATYTAYAKQDLFVAQIPLFQFLIFYNLNLEFGPGGDMILDGPVHANGDLIARNQYQKTNTLQFKERVTATGGFYANVTKLGAIYNNSGTADNNTGGTGPLLFQNGTGTVTDIKNSTLYRDYTWSTDASGTETETSRNKFRDWATTTYAGNFRAGVHGVSTINLPGVQELEDGTRKNAARVTIEPPDPADNSELVNSKFSRHAGLYIIVNPSDFNPARPADNARYGIKPDGTQVLMLPRTYRCWINYIDNDGIPHPVEVVLPGQPTYGDPDDPTKIIKNDLPNRFTNITAIGSNQVIRIPLPNTAALGEIADPYPDFATASGTKPNFETWLQYPTTTGYSLGAAAPTTAAFDNGYFFDLRRANGNSGYPANRPSTNFFPRPISKIDFDMTRFRLTVERTMYNSITSTNIFNPDVPTPTNWANNVLNSGAARKSYGLGIRTGASGAYIYTNFPLSATGFIAADPFRIYKVTKPGETPIPVVGIDLLNTAALSSPWYDGIAVYIHSVDAEDRSMKNATERNRVDSGVRLWNGRGPVVSLSPDGRTGMSLATNDALYIVGHFNADGTVNSNATSTSSYGGYSARYPDNSEERLCNVMADAITILSQPVFTASAGKYYQTGGWSDSFSANAYSSSNWSTSWKSTNPSSSNQYDGITDSRYAGHMPYDGCYATTATANFTATTNKYLDSSGVAQTYGYDAASTNRSTKFSGANTEVSSCLLVGIVATRSAKYPRENEFGGGALTYQPTGYQNSGGVHNFPRMLEDWTSGSAGLYLRSSMVAMFQSEVACEPWLGTRIYSAPGRYWGLHQNLRAENAASGLHDVPLEPMSINISRWHYAETKPAEYDAQVSAIEALPLAN